MTPQAPEPQQRSVRGADADPAALAARVHDGPIQRLTSARVQLGLVAFDPPERREARLTEIEAELSEAAGELVTLVREFGARIRSED